MLWDKVVTVLIKTFIKCYLVHHFKSVSVKLVSEKDKAIKQDIVIAYSLVRTHGAFKAAKQDQILPRADLHLVGSLSLSPLF